MTDKNIQKPIVLSIAGFDPSGGAGLLADIKTIENNGCYAMAVCTANTLQTDVYFKDCYWVDATVVLKQLQLLLDRFNIAAVKIGIIENLTLLEQLLKVLKAYKKELPIVLDPVLKSSSGHSFQGEKLLFSADILKNISLITPNYEEIFQLSNASSLSEKIRRLQQFTSVLLKGGHHPSEKGKDTLYLKDKTVLNFFPSEEKIYEKHGSGCILSSAITSYLAQGKSLANACEDAKRYTEKALQSNPTKLAYHS